MLERNEPHYEGDPDADLHDKLQRRHAQWQAKGFKRLDAELPEHVEQLTYQDQLIARDHGSIDDFGPGTAGGKPTLGQHEGSEPYESRSSHLVQDDRLAADPFSVAETIDRDPPDEEGKD